MCGVHKGTMVGGPLANRRIGMRKMLDGTGTTVLLKRMVPPASEREMCGCLPFIPLFIFHIYVYSSLGARKRNVRLVLLSVNTV